MPKINPFEGETDLPEEKVDVGEALERFAALFDEARYHEAHEVLDTVWMQTQGGDEDFFKGLIQAAICLHHYSRGNLDGAAKLYSGHRRYLASFLPEHRGIEVQRFLADMQAFLRDVVRRRPGAPEPAFSAESAPRLRNG